MVAHWHIALFFAQKTHKKHLLDMPIAKHFTSGIWNKKLTQEVACFFDLFDTSGGEKGWDSSSVNSDYIVQCFTSKNTPAMLMSFLSSANGRKEMNHDNTKAIGGYMQATSEWFVHLELQGIQLSVFCSG